MHGRSGKANFNLYSQAACLESVPYDLVLADARRFCGLTLTRKAPTISKIQSPVKGNSLQGGCKTQCASLPNEDQGRRAPRSNSDVGGLGFYKGTIRVLLRVLYYNNYKGSFKGSIITIRVLLRAL